MTGGKIQASHPAVGRVSFALLGLQIRPMGSAVRDEKRFSLDKELQAGPMTLPYETRRVLIGRETSAETIEKTTITGPTISLVFIRGVPMLGVFLEADLL